MKRLTFVQRGILRPRGGPRRRLRLYLRRWGYRLHLLRYCIHCDGSIVEAKRRGYGFEPDRWVWHEEHEREIPQGPLRSSRAQPLQCPGCGATARRFGAYCADVTACRARQGVR